MKKKNITLVFVAIVFSIIVGMIIGKSLLKYKEGEPDVVGSFSMNRDENLTVVANRKNISDKEAFARLLLKMYKENSFHSIKFSTDHGYATSLDMTVYSWKEDIENGKSIMQIEFRPIEYGKVKEITDDGELLVTHVSTAEGFCQMNDGEYYVSAENLAEDVQVGDIVTIWFNGMIQETYPAQLGVVYRIIKTQ